MKGAWEGASRPLKPPPLFPRNFHSPSALLVGPPAWPDAAGSARYCGAAGGGPPMLEFWPTFASLSPCKTPIPRPGGKVSSASCSQRTPGSIPACFAPAKGARESYERFSTFMDRFHVAGFRRLTIEFLSEAATLGTGRDDPAAGARHSGLPRDLGRRLAEEVRARRHLPRPLRQRGRHPRHPAQRFGAARPVSRPPDQGGARHRRPPLLRPFRRRHHRHPARAC